MHIDTKFLTNGTGIKPGSRKENMDTILIIIDENTIDLEEILEGEEDGE